MKNPLLSEIIELTNLPSDSIEKELMTLLRKNDISPESVSLEVLREAMVSYLQETMLEARKEYHELNA